MLLMHRKTVLRPSIDSATAFPRNIKLLSTTSLSRISIVQSAAKGNNK
jgi:hypothetical protein